MMAEVSMHALAVLVWAFFGALGGLVMCWIFMVAVGVDQKGWFDYQDRDIIVLLSLGFGGVMGAIAGAAEACGNKPDIKKP
jgi:hypothetical protein